MSKKDKRPHPKPPSEPTLRPDAEVYIEQARWLLEWHNRRSEAFVNRAVGVIGFDGVALALILQAPNTDLAPPGVLAWILTGLILASIVISAAFAAATMWAVGVTAPSPDQLRGWWNRHRNNPQHGLAAPNIAESFLDSQGAAGDSPVAAAREAANRRTARLKLALAPLAATIPLLALLAVDVLARAYN